MMDGQTKKTMFTLLVASMLFLSFFSFIPAGNEYPESIIDIPYQENGEPDLPCTFDRGTRASAEDFKRLYMLGYGSMIGFLNSIKSADVDNDQKEELVFGNKEGCIFVMEKNGTELALDWMTPPLMGNSYGLALGDVDGDTTIEIVVGAADGIVRVFGWNGTEFVMEWASPDLGNFAYGLDVGDVDDDGSMEIVVGTGEIRFDYDPEEGWSAGTSFDPYDENLYIFGFDGSYHQEWSTIIPALYDGTGIYNIAIGDTDNDGYNEIVIGTFEWELLGNDFEGRYGILGWDGGGYSYDWTIREIGNWVMGMGIGDTDNDGEMEIVIAVWDDAFYVYGYDSSAPEDMYFPEWQSSDLSPFTLAVGDTDDDGIMEIVEAEDDLVNLYEFTDPGYSQAWTSGVLEDHVTGLGVGQMDGAPPNEILIGNDYNTMIHSKVGAVYIEQAKAEGFGKIASIESFDIDQNGISELYVLSKTGTVTVLEAGTDGFQVTDTINIRDGRQFTNILIRDFDGDSDMEIVVVEGNTSISYSGGWLIRSWGGPSTVTFIEYVGSGYTISDAVFIDSQGTFAVDAGDVDNDTMAEVVIGGTSGDFIVVGYDGNSYQIENQTHISEDEINCIGIGDTDGDDNVEIGIGNDTNVLIVVGHNGNDFEVEWEGDLPGSLWFPLALDCASMDGDDEEEIFVKGVFNDPLTIQGWDGSGYTEEASLQNYDLTFEECLQVDEVLQGSLQLIIGSMETSMVEYSGGYSGIWSSDAMSSNAKSLDVADVDEFYGNELVIAHTGMILVYGVHKPPEAVLTVSKDIMDIAEDVEFNGSDSQGKGSLEYIFNFGDGEDSGWISSPLVTHSYTASGTYSISLTVRDGMSEESEPAFAEVVVRPLNMIPRAEIDSISPSPAVEEEAVSFQGHGEDDDGTIVAFEWTSSRDGNLSTSGTFISFSLSVGIHTIYFRVRDDRGDWSTSDTFKLKVEEKNPLPEAEIVSISPNPAIEGEQVTFSGQASDDGFITSYNWESDLDGFLSSKDFFIISTLSIGEHTITFKVQDNDDAWSEPAIAFLIVTELPENIPPTAVIDGISPTDLKEGESVTFFGHGEDEDGTIVDYLWESDTDGLLSDSRSFGTSELSPGVHVITFRVRDDRGDWSNAVQTTLEVEEEEEEPPFIEFDIPEPFKDEPMLFWFLVVVVLMVILALIVLAAVRRKGKRKNRGYEQHGGEQYYRNR